MECNEGRNKWKYDKDKRSKAKVVFELERLDSNVQGKHVRPQPEESGLALVAISHAFR